MLALHKINKKMLFLFALAASLALAGPLLAPREEHSPFIVGGVPVKTGEIPYIVSIGFYDQGRVLILCGGVLISPNFLLTAAHCASDLWPKEILYARAGSHLPHEGGILFNISTIYQHPSWNYSEGVDHDIAVWELAQTVEETPEIGFVTLPTQRSDPKPGEMATVSGWGDETEYGTDGPSRLMKVDVPIVPRKTCRSQFAPLEWPVTKNMVCAGYDEGGKDACYGDSGGPLVDSSGTLIGLVSWGYYCARPGFPGVYARVGNYIEWIAETIS